MLLDSVWEEVAMQEEIMVAAVVAAGTAVVVIHGLEVELVALVI